MADQPNRNAPELVLKRAITWLGLLIDVTGIEPKETSIKVSTAAGGETLAEVTLAEDIAALEKLAGHPVLRLADFDHVSAEFA